MSIEGDFEQLLLEINRLTLESEQASLQIPQLDLNLAYVDYLGEIGDPAAIALIVELIKIYTVIEYDYESTGYTPLDWDTLFSITDNSDGNGQLEISQFSLA